MVAERERIDARDRSNRQEMIERIASELRTDGQINPAPGVFLNRSAAKTNRLYGVTTPSLCIIAQGAKELQLGGKSYRYDAENFLVASVQLPVTASIIEASFERPYLALRVEFEPTLVSSVIVEAEMLRTRSEGSARAIAVSPLDADLRDAGTRLLRAVTGGPEQKLFVTLLKRELILRLLLTDQGDRLRNLPALSGNSSRIAQAVERLKNEFDRPLRVESLARELGMSSSGFHQHFKAFTEMSPLQFQKQLRLQEARRLMLSDDMDAASAGYKVGYDDPSHFSRDYKRLFGQSPMRDVDRLRTMIATP